MNALTFLNTFRPDGTHILTAIHPEKRGSVLTAPFRDDDEAMSSWIGQRQAEGYNLYFSVNSVIRPENKKASRDNIRALDYLHVDLDLPAGTTPETLEAERAKLLAQLTTDLPPGVPAPTWVVDSGGGYWGFWKLDEPLPIDGQQEAFDSAKRYNQQLEILFKADACHNVDRIARIPGLLNYPNAKKVKMRGADPLPTSVVQYNEGVSYPLSQFTQAPLQSAGNALDSAAAAAVEISGNLDYTDDVDAAFPDLSEKTKLLIVQGEDPENPGKFEGRSEWLFHVVCEMVRKNCSPDDIYMAITNPAWAISDSVRDKGGRMESYAKRQIQRALDHAIDPRLSELNGRHAVIQDIDGKCRIALFRKSSATDRQEINYQTFEDFRNAYSNRHVMIEYVNSQGEPREKKVPLGKWWIENENRRQYEAVVFAPQGCPPTDLNLWTGFSCSAIPGDCSLYLDHLRRNICGGDPVSYEYLLNWMAAAVQRPAEPGYAAIVLKGGRGTGKGEFVKKFGQLFGRHFQQVTDPRHIVGNFNAHLRDCVVLFADEAFAVDDKRAESMLKTLITEETMMIEGKGVNSDIGQNHLHILMASNEDWVVPAGSDERRYLVLEVGDGNKQDHEFFQAMNQQYENGGREALLHMLLNRDISQYNVRRVPATRALLDQKIHSLGEVERFWMACLMEGQFAGGEEWSNQAVCPTLYEAMQRDMFKVTSRTRGMMDKFLQFLYGEAAIEAGFPTVKYKSPEGLVVDGELWQHVFCYWVPDLDDARRIFAEKVLEPDFEWPAVTSFGAGEEAF